MIPLPLPAKPNKHLFEFIAEEGDSEKGKNDIQGKGRRCQRRRVSASIDGEGHEGRCGHGRRWTDTAGDGRNRRPEPAREIGRRPFGAGRERERSELQEEGKGRRPRGLEGAATTGERRRLGSWDGYLRRRRRRLLKLLVAWGKEPAGQVSREGYVSKRFLLREIGQFDRNRSREVCIAGRLRA